MNEFLRSAKKRQAHWTQLYQRLHSHPELSFQEYETTRLIREEVQKLGLEILPLGTETGLLCLLRGAKPGPLVALRADIDAIAETDRGEGAVRSLNPGVMHACGHDVHTCCVLGAAALLCERQDSMHGDVAFLFQPAEEVTEGAKAVLAHGFLQKLPRLPTAFFSLHVDSFAAGYVGVRTGAVAASKTHFRIRINGRTGQGGFPHECVDPIVAGAALISAIQTIVSRNADPRKALVCAVYNAHAGEHEFFVCDEMRLSGSIRALDEATAKMAQKRIEELCTSLPAAYGCTATLEWIPHVPILENDAQLAPLAEKAAELVVGKEWVLPASPMLGSDDFAVFGEHVPLYYYRLGAMDSTGPFHALHSPTFTTNSAALSVGSAVLAQAADLALLNHTQNPKQA